MKRSPRLRMLSNLSESVNHRLNMYALAAGAAGVSLFALASPTEAMIVYTATHRVIHPNSSYNLDLNHDGKADFTFANHYWCTDGLCRATLSVRGPYGLVAGYAGLFGTPFAYALKAGARIGPEISLVGRIMYGSGGQWFDVTRRYLGLAFQVKGITHYGWARLNVINHGFAITATLTGYAYETIPDKPIIAGKTKGSIVEGPDAALTAPTPEPTSLGLLALGSPGLSIWRRQAEQ